MSEVKNIWVKKILVGLVFMLLLAGPTLLKPKGTTKSSEGEFGFEFEEVGADAGITFKHQSPILDEKINHILPQIASMGASVAACDFNNDGWNDLYFTNSRTGTKNVLYRNNKDGTFTDVADEMGIGDLNKKETGVSMGSIWGDINNDGSEDLFVYKWGKPELFLNSGEGFERITEKSGLPEWINANTAVWLDFNSDGLLDLFIGGYYSEKVNLWKLETTRFMPESYEYANNGGRNYLMKNKGDGTFTDVTTEYGLTTTKWTLSAGALDVNDDGFIDLVIANDFSIDEFYVNVEGKKFVEVGKEVGIGFTPKSGMNVSFGDVDNNGDLGFYVTNISEKGVLLQGNNFWVLKKTESGLEYKNVARSKRIELGGWSYSAQFGDFNNDGYQDLYVANGYISGKEGTSYWYDYSKVSGGNNAIISDANNWPPMEGKSQSGYQQNMIWLNKGDGTFKDISNLVCEPKALDSRAVVLADLWNRGVLDVIVANQNNVPLVYKNISFKNNHWIDFDLIGSNSNKSAIGAKIELYWNDKVQTQIINGGIGFCSQNQHRLHFGLGSIAKIDSAVITWPDGKITKIDNPEADKVHKVMEAR